MNSATPTETRSIFTIGHGNRPLEEFTGLLNRSAVACLVDVRAYPGSRRHPHFGRGELEQTLPAAGVRYIWEGKALGGRRRPRPDSPHCALRNESFRAYADHMETDEFRAGLDRLLEHVPVMRVAIMCAERLPWQCHRFLIADYLVAHDVGVFHVIDKAAPRAHRLRAEARIHHGLLVYDRQMQDDLRLD